MQNTKGKEAPGEKIEKLKFASDQIHERQFKKTRYASKTSSSTGSNRVKASKRKTCDN